MQLKWGRRLQRLLMKIKFEYSYLVCAIPVLLFLMLTHDFWGEAPSLDPMVIYRESTQFFNGGIKEIVSYGVSIHPPLIYILNSLGFLIFGKTPFSYNIVGFVIYFLSLILLYSSTKRIFNEKFTASLVLLLFSNPFIIINSFYLTNDMLTLFGIILALWGFLYARKILLAFILVIVTLMKETALIIITSLLIVIVIEELMKKSLFKEKLLNLTRATTIFLPSFCVIILWSFYLKSLGTTEWREMYFIHTTDSSYLVILKNIVQLKIFNINLIQNLRNAFILNFQWIYLLTSIILFLFTKRVNFLKTVLQKKYFFVIFTMTLLYSLIVFSFPTWTIPRYSIPIFLGLFLVPATALSLLKSHRLYFLLLGMLLTISVVANLSSIDPISSLNGRISIDGINYYNINFWNGGPDRITYNLQHLELTKKQNKLIKNAIERGADFILTDCNETKLGEKIYSISMHNDFYPKLKLNKSLECINNFDIRKNSVKLNNKLVFTRKGEVEEIEKLFGKFQIKPTSILIED